MIMIIMCVHSVSLNSGSFSDCIECMACSDNTIRAGLTPKFKDIETLCANLTYAMSGPPIFPHKDVAPGIKLYDPPVEEFAVEALEVQRVSFSYFIKICNCRKGSLMYWHKGR